MDGSNVVLDQAVIRYALSAMREGRSTGSPTLEPVVNALGRCRARAWARFRVVWPNAPEAEIDAAADMAVEVLASVPILAVMLVIADVTTCAEAGGTS